MALRGYTVMSPGSDEDSAIAQSHAAHARGGALLPLENRAGHDTRPALRRQRPPRQATGLAASSGGGGNGPTLGSNGGQTRPLEAAPRDVGDREHGRGSIPPHDGAEGGTTPPAAAAPNAGSSQLTAHDLGLSLGIPEEVLTAVELQLESTCDMTLEDLANVPELFWNRALDQTRFASVGSVTAAQDPLGVASSRPLPPMMASKLTRWWRKAQLLCPPDLPRPPTQKIKIITEVASDGGLPQGFKRKMEGIAEQRDDTMYTPLSEEDVDKMRTVHYDRTGDHPPECERPSADQLTVLSARIKAGRAPWVDFAVWCSYSVRRVKENAFRPQVWVNNQLETRTIHGPTNMESWMINWRVFRAAMIMVEGATPAVLDKYANGLRNLLARHPHSWGLICIADGICREEKWFRLMEDHRKSPDFDPHAPMPWNAIIRSSAFRVGEGSLQAFWDENVQHPSTLIGAERKQFFAQVDGRQGTLGNGGGKDTRGTGAVPSGPYPPSSHTDRSGGAPWAQLAIEDQSDWQQAPDKWTRKEWKKGQKGGKGKEGKGGGQRKRRQRWQGQER